MQITSAPTALPGHCFLCRSANRPWFVDTMLSVDYDDQLLVNEHIGAVYICSECCMALASMAKWVPPEKYTEWQEKSAELEVTNIHLKNKVGSLEDALRNLVDVGYNPSDVNTPMRSSDTLFEDTTESDEAVPVGESELGEGEGETPKSIDDEGVGELHSDDSGDDSVFSLNL
jgi:hypothetical protein